MIRKSPMDNTEVYTEIFDSAVSKNKNCPHAVIFLGHRSCKLFDYIFDTSTDVTAYCGCCMVNTKKPTTSKYSVR